jgi:hypothetical protein
MDQLLVVMTVLAAKSIDDQIRLRITEPALRGVSITVSDKEFQLMEKDIRDFISTKSLEYAGIFLYGNGIVIAELITKKIMLWREDLAKTLPSDAEAKAEKEESKD